MCKFRRDLMHLLTARRFKFVCIIIAVSVTTYISYKLTTTQDLKSDVIEIPSQRIETRQLKTVYNSRNERRMEFVRVANQSLQTSLKRRLPDVVGIGVKKCGTGAMIRFLAQHPLVEIPDALETYFFSDKIFRDYRYYKSLMPLAYDHQLIAEKSPSYFDVPGVVERVKQGIPKAKFILSLCDPTNRAFSEFVHLNERLLNVTNAGSTIADEFHQRVVTFLQLFSSSNQSLDERYTIAEDTCRGSHRRDPNCIFARGIYYPHVSEWQNSFNESQLLIVDGEKWITNPGELVEKEIEFLSLPKLITREDFMKNPQNGLYCLNKWWHQIFHKRLKTTGERDIRLKNGNVLFCLGGGKGRTRTGSLYMHDKTRRLLRNFYFPYNKRLYEMLGHLFDW